MFNLRYLAGLLTGAALTFSQTISLSATPINSNILDGTPTAVRDYPYVAELDLDGGLCTGTLISSRHVLSAAHCFHDEKNRRITNYQNFSVLLNGVSYAVSNVTIHPSYVSRSAACIEGEVDAAVVELATTASGTPIPLQRTAPAVGSSLLLVGFGTQGTGEGGEDDTVPERGLVNFGTTTIESTTDTYVEWNFDRGASEANTGAGDSGGPAFIDIGGVRHINSITCGGTGNAGFDTSSSNTRADLLAPWVDSIVGTTQANTAPAFISLPNQTVAVNQALSYPVQVSGTAPVTVSATSILPEGVSFDGAKLVGTPTTPGFYTITFSASNSAGSATGALTLNVMQFDPLNALSVGRVTVSFEDDEADLVAIRGKLTLWNKFTPKGSVVTVKIAELADSFTLNKRGAGRKPGGYDSVEFEGRIANGRFTNPKVGFYIGLGDSESLFDKLDNLFPLVPKNGETVPLPVEITIQGVTYQNTVTMKYRRSSDTWVSVK